jgi:hypothetical protein
MLTLNFLLLDGAYPQWSFTFFYWIPVRASVDEPSVLPSTAVPISAFAILMLQP